MHTSNCGIQLEKFHCCRSDFVPRLTYAGVEGVFLELVDCSPVRRCTTISASCHIACNFPPHIGVCMFVTVEFADAVTCLPSSDVASLAGRAIKGSNGLLTIFLRCTGRPRVSANR